MSLPMQWVRTKGHPPCRKGQRKVLMYSVGWAAAVTGLYTSYLPAKERWAEYDQQADKYVDEERTPEYWCAITLPED